MHFHLVTHHQFQRQCGAAATRAPSHSLNTDCAPNSTSHLPWRHRCLSSSFWLSHSSPSPIDPSPCCECEGARSELTSSNTPRGGSVYGASSMSQSQFADPLASTGYDVDPWSGTQSPSRVSTPSLPVAPVASTSSAIPSSHPDLDAFLGECSYVTQRSIADRVRRPAHRVSRSLATARS